LLEDGADFDFDLLCDAERDFCSAIGAGAGAGAATPRGDGPETNFGVGAGARAGDEFSRLLAGLPARVCDGADCEGADLEADGADLEADGADCEAAVPERRLSSDLSDLPGEITFGSGYAEGGATSWTIGFASRRSSDFSDFAGEIIFGVG